MDVCLFVCRFFERFDVQFLSLLKIWAFEYGHVQEIYFGRRAFTSKFDGGVRFVALLDKVIKVGLGALPSHKDVINVANP